MIIHTLKDVSRTYRWHWKPKLVSYAHCESRRDNDSADDSPNVYNNAETKPTKLQYLSQRDAPFANINTKLLQPFHRIQLNMPVTVHPAPHGASRVDDIKPTTTAETLLRYACETEVRKVKTRRIEDQRAVSSPLP